MPQRVGIIGYPIGHSLSPVLQQVAFDQHGIAASYQAWQVAPDEVPDFVRGLRETGTLGCNVTVPHKETVIPFLDQVDAWASRAGAVNTIVNRDGRLEGYNTDGIGFLRALKEDAGVSATGKRILIVGAGGAAKGGLPRLGRRVPGFHHYRQPHLGTRRSPCGPASRAWGTSQRHILGRPHTA